MRETRRFLAYTIVVAAASLAAALPARALEVWSGRTFHFQKADYADWTLPENQDRITDQVWITRKDEQGVFNIAQEESYVPFVSPLDTEWATGDAADWQNLTFATWQNWIDSYPPDMIGVDACVHLISEDIYLDIRFEQWTAGAVGGGFAYYRAAGDPTPAADDTWAKIKVLFR
jgi:hypothetical protein